MSIRRGTRPTFSDVRTIENSVSNIGNDTLNEASRMQDSNLLCTWLRYKGGFFKGWTIYYFVLSRTNQLTAYASDDYHGKTGKFQVQAMMIQPYRSIHLGFVVTTIKDGAITLAATNGQDYKDWIEILAEKQPVQPLLTRASLEFHNNLSENQSVPIMEGSQSTDVSDIGRREVLLYVPTTVIPIQNHDKLLNKAREEIKILTSHFGQVAPHRGNLDDASIIWRVGKPEYALVDLAFLQGKTCNHNPQSLEWMIQNLVKRWEMEVSHKANPKQWTTVHPEQFSLSVNMGPPISVSEVHQQGKYISFLSQCPRHVYDSAGSSREQSYLSFSSSFPDGFAWEVLQVFTALPRISFSWRHWGYCAREKKLQGSEGTLVELTGFAIIEVDPNMRIMKMELFFKPEPFLETLRKCEFNETPALNRRTSASRMNMDSGDASPLRRTIAQPNPPQSLTTDDTFSDVEAFLRCPHGISNMNQGQSQSKNYSHTMAS